MSEITANPIVRVGVDLAKRVIQVHGVDNAGKVVTNRALPRDKFLIWCAQLPAGCVLAMEACAGSHHWARQLGTLGLTAKIIPTHLVSPYRLQGKGGKNDATDAAAICEAAARPSMRFVPMKSAERQGVLVLHRTRELLVRQRTMLINAIRGHCAEFGIVAARGAVRVAELIEQVRRAETSLLPDLARSAILMLGEQLDALLKNAETAMYRVKEDGRNTYRFFTPEMRVLSAAAASDGNISKGTM